MLNKTQPTNTELIVTRDNKLDPAYKRRVVIKQGTHVITAVLSYFGGLGLALGSFVALGTIQTLQDVKRNVALDVMDYRYHTSLRAQYHSGLRTQKILAAKRTYGL